MNKIDTNFYYNSRVNHICYSLNDGYVDYCCISIISLLENNFKNRFHIHLLTDNLCEESIKRLKQTTEYYNTELSIHNIDDQKLVGQKMTWSKYTWYRIFAHEFIEYSIDKILYLDVDTIILGNITELFELTLSDKAIAAVPDIMTIYPKSIERVGYDFKKGYFCAGVLLMNLNYFRDNNLPEKILTFALENPDRIQFPDQDALNYICQDSKINLPLKFDILDPFFRDKKFISKYKSEVKEALEDPRIVHYAGCNPWKYESTRHFFYDEFWKYAKLYPYSLKKKHIYSGITLLKLKIKQLLGLLGFPSFKKYKKVKKVSQKDIYHIISNIS